MTGAFALGVSTDMYLKVGDFQIKQGSQLASCRAVFVLVSMGFPGHHVVSMWKPCGVHVEIMWCQCGSYVASTCKPSTVHLETK